MPARGGRVRRCDAAGHRRHGALLRYAAARRPAQGLVCSTRLSVCRLLSLLSLLHAHGRSTALLYTDPLLQPAFFGGREFTLEPVSCVCKQ